MKSTQLLQFSAVLAMGPLIAQAAAIQGTITGSTVTGTGIDDKDTASTINISYFSFCPFIVAGATAFPAFNFVFAGQGPIGSNFKPIDPGDFTVSQYIPWVVNNNATTNNITDPSGRNLNRGVTGQDAGGADIEIFYTPLNAGDPTSVNFVQAFVQNTNNTGFNTGTIDSSPTSPYYNFDSTSGTGTSNLHPVPLVTNSTTPAWLADIPYRCENGPIPPGASQNCALGADDTLLSQTQIFQTFIESDQTFDGKTYQVLYGGIQWGYSYSNVDTPEPSTLLMLGGVFAATGLGRRLRRLRRSV